MSKKNAMEMAKIGDKAHIAKMEEMKILKPEAHKEWFEKAQKQFDTLPEDK